MDALCACCRASHTTSDDEYTESKPCNKSDRASISSSLQEEAISWSNGISSLLDSQRGREEFIKYLKTNKDIKRHATALIECYIDCQSCLRATSSKAQLDAAQRIESKYINSKTAEPKNEIPLRDREVMIALQKVTKDDLEGQPLTKAVDGLLVDIRRTLEIYYPKFLSSPDYQALHQNSQQ